MDVSAEGVLVDLVFLESFSSFFVGLFPWGHLKSILKVIEADCSNVLAFTLMVFSTASSQKSKSRPRVSNCAQIEGFRPSLKYRIIIFLSGVVARSNS